MSSLMRTVASAIVVTFLLLSSAAAVEPDEIMGDPALEARAREISAEVRCVVCQNQSIDSSNAEMARDMRIIVRERLAAGDANSEVFDYLVARYGDFILFRPPLKTTTYALWLTPFALALIALAIGLTFLARRPRKPALEEPPLSADEERILEDLHRIKQ